MAEAPKTLALRLIEDLWNQRTPAFIDVLLQQEEE
jgi:hypothetical protein